MTATTEELAANLRERVLGVVHLLADEDLQRRYQTGAPHIDVPAELFNQWEDAFSARSQALRDAFTDVEWLALLQLDATVHSVSGGTPKFLPPLDEFIATAEWRLLWEAARHTQGLLERRG